MNNIALSVLYVFLLTLTLTTHSNAGKLTDYQSADSYYEQHPEQLQLREILSQAVANPPVAIPSNTPIRIAVLYPGIQLSDYWKRSIDGLERRLQHLNIAYELQVRFTRPGTQLIRQEKGLQELLEWQPDYLIYTIDSPAQKNIVERLIHQDKPKVILQNITTPIKDWGNKQPFLYTGFDHMEGAKLLARYYRKKFPKGTEYGVLFWTKGTVSDLRGISFIRDMDRFHTLKASYFTQADQQSAYNATIDMLSKPNNIRYIYVCATDLAIGASKALQDLGRDDISINGWGGGQIEIEMLQEGKLDVVLMRMNDDSSIAIAEAIKRDIDKEDNPLIYTGKFTILDSTNSEQEIDLLFKKAFRYSNQ